MAPHKISTLSIIVSEDEDGEEVYRVYGGPDDPGIPIIGINRNHDGELRELAQTIANNDGKPVRIISFTRESSHDTVAPFATGDKLDGQDDRSSD